MEMAMPLRYKGQIVMGTRAPEQRTEFRGDVENDGESA